MSEIEQEMRAICKELIENKKLDLIIGYELAFLPLRTRPSFIDNVNDVYKLVWNPYCQSNLAKYLTQFEKGTKIGIISKGCVGRAIIHLAREKQVNRDDITIIAVPCEGYVDRKKIERYVKNREIIKAKEENDKIILKFRDSEMSIIKNDFLNYLCTTCKYKISPNYDFLVGDKEPEMDVKDNFEDVKEFESKSPDEKWNDLQELLKNCIRCYSCRETCPMCYCEMCFIDQSQPIWFDKTIDISDIMIFHIIRATHLAGRCVGCGDCSVVCPMEIDLSIINRELEKIVKERFDFTSGIDLEAKIPLATYKLDDKEDFMIQE